VTRDVRRGGDDRRFRTLRRGRQLRDGLSIYLQEAIDVALYMPWRAQVLQRIIKTGETEYMSGSEIKVVGEVGWKILVVGDEQIILDLLKRVLNREGYQVSTARFADEAVAEICSQEYDLAITDVDLRHTDGRELTERIWTASPRTAIVLMTGHREEEIVRFAEAHAQGLLHKPFALDQLLATVRVALESRVGSTQGAGVVPPLESGLRAEAQA